MKRLDLPAAARAAARGRVFAAALAAALLSACTYTQLAYTPPPEPEYDYEFEGGYSEDAFVELDPYGAWVETATFGVVWQPRVVAGWQPYANGHWAWTEWGWGWVSYEPFGWATYHYGHWYFDPAWGWIWIPGYEWYPHRVTWTVYDDYVCWAPMPPRGYYVGDPWSAEVGLLWVVVDSRHFINSDVGRYKVRNIRPAFSQTTGVVRKAPDRRYIEKKTRQVIPPADIRVKHVKKGSRQLTRVKLPPEQRKTVERYKARTEKKVLRDKPETEPARKKKTYTGSKSKRDGSRPEKSTRDKRSGESGSKKKKKKNG